MVTYEVDDSGVVLKHDLLVGPELKKAAKLSSRYVSSKLLQRQFELRCLAAGDDLDDHGGDGRIQRCGHADGRRSEQVRLSHLIK